MVASCRASRRVLQQARYMRAMDQRGHGCDQVDPAVVPNVGCERGAASASCTRLQSRQLPAHAGNAGADRGLVADQPEGAADQNRREGGEPQPLYRFPNSRGRHPTADVPGVFCGSLRNYGRNHRPRQRERRSRGHAFNSNRWEECAQRRQNGQISLSAATRVPEVGWLSAPRDRLALGPDKSQYSRQSGSRPGNHGLSQPMESVMPLAHSNLRTLRTPLVPRQRRFSANWSRALLLGTLLFATLNSPQAQDTGALPTVQNNPAYPAESEITFQWNYVCPIDRPCTFVCRGAGGGGGSDHVTRLDIYLGTLPLSSDQPRAAAVFYYFASREFPHSGGFAISTGINSLSCQINGMNLVYSGPPMDTATTTLEKTKPGSPGDERAVGATR